MKDSENLFMNKKNHADIVYTSWPIQHFEWDPKFGQEFSSKNILKIQVLI